MGKDLVHTKKRTREDIEVDGKSDSSSSGSDSDSSDGERDWLDAAKKRLKVIKNMRKEGASNDPPPIPTGDIFGLFVC